MGFFDKLNETLHIVKDSLSDKVQQAQELKSSLEEYSNEELLLIIDDDSISILKRNIATKILEDRNYFD